MGLGLAACVVVAACSSSDDNGNGNADGSGGATGAGGLILGNGNSSGTGNSSGSGNSSGTGAGNAAGSGNTSGTGAGNSTSGTGSTSGSTGEINACDGTTRGCLGNQYAGENLPLDIYIMFDQSCSMSCPSEQTGAGLCCTGGPNPRIDQVRTAVSTFLQDQNSNGIGVGIGYFGYMEAGQTSCDPSQYAAPSVKIGALPGNAQAVLNSLNKAVPTGETPTGAAIRGACTYASQYAKATPTHTTVVLLVTDGFPEAPVSSRNGGCSPSIPDATQAATTCLDAKLPVYVLGVGHQLTNLNDIAVAGGTKQAYLVEGADVEGAIVKALNEIRASAQIPCQLKLPPAPDGQNVDIDKVNVAFCDASKASQTFPRVTQTTCGTENGWYYDNEQNPTQIVLCQNACGAVSRPGGSLVTSVGCTQVRGGVR
jgi:hypothetical protein